MANNGSGQYIYTFTPKFHETATLYIGLTRLWIGDGRDGEFGYLYAEYSTGRVQNLGLASEYGLAKKYFEDLGKDINYEQWIEILVNTPDNAQISIDSKNTAIEKASESSTSANEAEQSNQSALQAKTAAELAQSKAEQAEDNSEAWAVGQIDGIDVPSSHINHHNNSKYYSEQSEASKNTAVSAKNTAVTKANEAASSKTAAQNAQTASETAQSKAETAQSKAENAQNAAEIAKSKAETAQSNAEKAEGNSESWAVGKRNNVDVGTTDPAYHNNSKYYSQVAYQYAESIKGVNLVISYQNSTNGTTVPTGTWNPTPSPTKGQYLWTRTVYNWTDARSSTSYTVTYIGADGDGNVNSVNGKKGHVVLHASDITMSQSDNTSVFDMLQIATTSEIDALFN